MPRPRNAKNRGLPPNLYEHLKGFRYRRPDRSWVYLGYNRPAAIEAAIAANAHFVAKSTLFDKIVAGDEKTLATVIADFIEKKLSKAEVKPKTRKDRQWTLQSIARSRVASKLVDQVTTRDLHDYLETLDTDWVRQARRSMLNQVFKWAIQTGLREDNPAAQLDSPQGVRKRARLDLEIYRCLHALAPQWLQNQMDLQLHTLQRPGDVLLMRWEQVRDGFLYIEQQKTGRRLKLKIEPSLALVIQRSRDTVLSPFIVHRKPEHLRTLQERAKNRLHHTQVLIQQADRAFALVRNASGLYGPNDFPPTLHEIRSLGASLYRIAGWSEGEVQRLLGHSEIKMTRHYLDGHEAPWDEVTAGLVMP